MAMKAHMNAGDGDRAGAKNKYSFLLSLDAEASGADAVDPEPV
jgi:hypothetical protein